ncbi:EAL domain-containing protein [Fulvimarina sp. MAC3]|uniref:putative bifunctional diguanylate cyclase/phosphodiesterase n=1 Tax=Fulvimarina sp. MAC3 TaxID=3148887 RepID=UPI0031FD519C
MRVVSCLLTEHNPWLVFLAAAMCLIGSVATVRLWKRSLIASGRSHLDWCFLTAVTAGAAIWATHFIAMLGYEPPAAVTFDPQLTIISIVTAILGTALGFWLSASRNPVIARALSGATLGLTVAAMHFVGMFAYRVDGIVTWHPDYLGAAIALSLVFSMATTWIMTLKSAPLERHRTTAAVGTLVLAIVSLHFTGMAAFEVSPILGVSVGADAEAFGAMAMSIAVVALLIVFTGLSSHLIDDRSRQESERELIYIATHDELTGLANRRFFKEALSERCDRFRLGTGERFALMMIDLDRFKPVNDTLGHSVGDIVLTRLAGRLRKLLCDGELLARLGGDEFVVICGDGADEAKLRNRADAIVEILSRPIIVQGHVIELGASVGVTTVGNDGATPEELTQNADVALYAAKAAGRSTYQFYKPSMSSEIQARRALEADLRRAVIRQEFEVYYQPQTDAKTGAFTGAEALIRWQHPERGLLSPAVFIPLAEELGLIGEIGSWVLRKACQEAATWPAHLTVAVNLSPIQLVDRRLARIVKSALSEFHLPAHRLELEITETSLIGNDVQALAVLNEIRALGVFISLDDFGTGYSSLSYLHRFPIDRIKIDRSFISRIPSDPDSLAIIQAITQLGKSLGMKITAEGIETHEQQTFTRVGGCDHLQGYLISKPIPYDDVTRLFQSDRSSEAAA